MDPTTYTPYLFPDNRSRRTLRNVFHNTREMNVWMVRTSTAVLTVLHKGVVIINTPHAFVIRQEGLLYHRCISKYSHGSTRSLLAPSSSPAPHTAQFLLLPYGRTPIQQNTPGEKVYTLFGPFHLLVAKPHTPEV